MTDKNLCKICMQPRTVGTGSITDWIVACQCNLLGSEEELFSSLRICTVCHRRINIARQGSLTQWIFRSDLCNCESPKILVQAEQDSSSNSQDSITLSLGYPELENLETDFPFDRFKPIEELGRGSSGIVFRCQDRMLSTIVAIKVLVDLDPRLVVSFQAEARIIASLTHQNIIRIIDIGVTEAGTPYMVLEYVSGISLSQLLLKIGTLSLREAVRVTEQFTSALHYAYGSGILHRDVKSANILIEKDSDNALQAKLIDFGLSTILHKNLDLIEAQGATFAGTPGYMSPDQANGFSFDHRSDIYSVGCVLYEMLTGSLLFSGETAIEILGSQLNPEKNNLDGKIESIQCPQKLKAIIRKCLEIDPDARYQSAQDLQFDLGLCLELVAPDEDTELNTPQELAFDHQTKPPNRLLAALLALLLCGLVGLAYFFSGHKSPETEVRKQSIDDRQSVLYGKGGVKTELAVFKEAKEQPGRLSGNEFVDDQSLEQLKDRKDITDLDLYRCMIKGSGLQHLKRLPLKSLCLDNSTSTDQDLQSLSEIKSLTSLRLNRGQITGRTLGSLQSLKELWVCQCPIDDDGLKSISNIPKLRTLGVSADQISAVGIDHLARAGTLRTLCLEGDNDMSAILNAAGRIRKLIILQFENRHVRVEDLEAAKKLDIRMLNLINCTLSAGCVEALSKMTNLKSLSFNKTSISLADKRKLRRCLPDCKLVMW